MLPLLFILTIIACFGMAFMFFRICSLKYDNKDRTSSLAGYTIIVIFAYLFLYSLICSVNKQPRAIDVYRGYTELEIKKTFINDSIVSKCDSIVIFKKH